MRLWPVVFLLGLTLTGMGIAEPSWELQFRGAAAKRMPIHEMELFHVVNYKDKHFGLSTYNTRDDARSDLGKVTIWEYLNGKWSYIFDYELPMRYDPEKGSHQAQVAAERARRDALFAKYGFSSTMRVRLESKLKKEWGHESRERVWPDFL